MTTLNADPTTRLAALLDRAYDADVEVTEAPLEGGFVIVKGTLAAVTEWMNGVPDAFGWMQDFGCEVYGARVVTE